MFSKDFFIRDFEGDAYREGFLVSAVVTVFVIRIFLALTDYPQLGTRNFHIAHTLYGGFFMMVAILVLLSFLSKKAGYVASVLGGIGFGFFIDEFGKYITHNNDYFYQPTIGLIYISFVLLYLITKFIPNARKPDEKEYLVNAIEMIKESAINDFDTEEEKRAIEYLKRCDPENPIVQSLTSLLKKIDATETPAPNIYTRLRVQLRKWYYAVARSGIILKVVMVYLVLQTVSTFFQTAIILMTRPTLGIADWGKLYSSSLAGVFILMGFFSLRFSKVEAYRFFRIALLITIFLTEFFAFMRSEWLELINLSANIFILLVINYAQTEEKKAEDEKKDQQTSHPKHQGSPKAPEGRKETQEKLDTIVERNNYMLFKAKSIFPIALFPDTLIIDMTKVTIINKQFFATEHVTDIPLKSIADVFIQTALFSAALTITYMPHTDRPGVIQPVEAKILALPRTEALVAKEIIRGMVVAHEDNIDLTNVTLNDLRQKLQDLGRAKTPMEKGVL